MFTARVFTAFLDRVEKKHLAANRVGATEEFPSVFGPRPMNAQESLLQCFDNIAKVFFEGPPFDKEVGLSENQDMRIQILLAKIQPIFQDYKQVNYGRGPEASEDEKKLCAPMVFHFDADLPKDIPSKGSYVSTQSSQRVRSKEK